MTVKELLEVSKRFGYRSIPTAERAMRDALAIDKDGGTDTTSLVEFAALLEFIESNPKMFLNKKDQIELSDYDQMKGPCLSFWCDDVVAIEKFRALCYTNLPRDLGWFHQSNCKEFQMFEFWKPQSDTMRNIATRIAEAMEYPLIVILQKDYRPDVNVPLDAFVAFDPEGFYQRGKFSNSPMYHPHSIFAKEFHMAMINGKFVNLGCCGHYESAEGIGNTSISGTRNFGKDPWPRMDIGQIDFYNPTVATDESARNRRLTRNQALWLNEKIGAYINTLTFPAEEEFDHTQNGRLKVERDPESDKENIPETLVEYLTRSAQIAEEEGKKGWAGAMREAIGGLRIIHSLEASLTEAVRDHPSWARACDHQALTNARAFMKTRL